jgi:hypothetical protein
MSFQEKSAWGLLAGIVLVSYFYFPVAFEVTRNVPHGAPLIAISVAGVIAIVIIEAVYHSLIAISARGATEADERDQLIDLKAERVAGFVFGCGLFTLVGHIVIRSSMEITPVPGSLTIAVWILLALTTSEIAKLVAQIWYYRTGA